MNNNQQASWQDLPVRIFSAVIIVPVALICIVWGEWYYIGMISIISIVMVYEWENLFKISYKNFKGCLFLFWPVIAYCAALEGMWTQSLYIILGFAFIFGPQLWLGSVIIGGAGLSLLWLRFMTGFQTWMVIWIVSVVIASDSCAYLVGKLVGGPKLIPSVSPGKTWSGAIGGLIGAGCVGACIIGYLNQGIGHSYLIGCVLSVLIGIMAQIGDLLESKLKRILGVKDSGKIIPGHGGVLDRCDALLTVSILVALLTFFLPSEIEGVKWNGGSLANNQLIFNIKPNIPLYLFK